MKEEKQKKKNKYIEFIKELYKSKRGRALLFFLFYIIFFVIIISMIRSSYNERPNYDEKESNINVEYKLDGIEKGNYHFTREENINGEITNFTGDKSNNRIEGVMTNNNTFYNYFIYDSINLIKTTDKYEITNELYHFNNITDDKTIKNIINKSTLISKTEYETGNISYNYEVTTNTIDSILNNTNIDIDMPTNKITLEANEENEVIKITYDLSSYATYINNTPMTMSISINYSNFGEIEDIEIPEN